MGSRLVDTGSGYDAQSDLPVHFGVPGGQPVDVEVTVLLSGQRSTVRIENVDPRDHQGAALIVQVDENGNLVR